jgi:hypothetical protein
MCGMGFSCALMGDECPSGTIHVALLQLNPEHDKTLDAP